MAGIKEIKLRITQLTDLEQFFLFQLDEEAGYLAAFMPKNQGCRNYLLDRQKILGAGNCIKCAYRFFKNRKYQTNFWTGSL